MILAFNTVSGIVKIMIKDKKIFIATASTNYRFVEFSKYSVKIVRRNKKYGYLLKEEKDDWVGIKNAKNDEEIKEIIIKEMQLQGNELLGELSEVKDGRTD